MVQWTVVKLPDTCDGQAVGHMSRSYSMKRNKLNIPRLPPSATSTTVFSNMPMPSSRNYVAPLWVTGVSLHLGQWQGEGVRKKLYESEIT